jgi:hypothetical protein
MASMSVCLAPLEFDLHNYIVSVRTHTGGAGDGNQGLACAEHLLFPSYVHFSKVYLVQSAQCLSDSFFSHTSFLPSP